MKTVKEIISGIALGLITFVLMVLMLTVRAYAVEPEYAKVFEDMTENDYQCLRYIIQAECGNTNRECCEATVCVILNRVLSDKYPNTVSKVISQKGQFSTRSYMWEKEPTALVDESIEAVREHGAQVIRDKLAEQGWDFDATDYVYFASKKQSCAVNHLFCGEHKKWQYHYIGRSK